MTTHLENKGMAAIVRCLIAIFASICMTLAIITPANAYSISGYVLNGGVGNYGYSNRYYYVDSSCSNLSYLTTDIASAWSDWIYTTSSLGITTPISVINTGTKSNSVFDFYYQAKYPSSDGVYGVTLFWTGTSLAAPEGYMPSNNWGWAQIILNNPNFSYLSRNISSLNKRKGVVAHEIGHAMGLQHVSYSYRLMYPYGDTVTVDACTSDELNGINALY